MLRDGHLVLEGLFAVMAKQFDSIHGVHFDVLGIVAGIREGFVALRTFVRFVAYVAICVSSILVLAGEHFPTKFTVEALEVRVVLGVHRTVSLQIVASFEILSAHVTNVGLGNRIEHLIVPSNVFVKVT